jgi:hypothetical protein
VILKAHLGAAFKGHAVACLSLVVYNPLNPPEQMPPNNKHQTPHIPCVFPHLLLSTPWLGISFSPLYFPGTFHLPVCRSGRTSAAGPTRDWYAGQQGRCRPSGPAGITDAEEATEQHAAIPAGSCWRPVAGASGQLHASQLRQRHFDTSAGCAGGFITPKVCVTWRHLLFSHD